MPRYVRIAPNSEVLRSALNNELLKSSDRVEWLSFFFACSCASKKSTNWFYHPSWLWSGLLAQMCLNYSEIANPQYLHYLILDLVLNGKYSESVSWAWLSSSNHFVAFLVFKLINLRLTKHVLHVLSSLWACFDEKNYQKKVQKK